MTTLKEEVFLTHLGVRVSSVERLHRMGHKQAKKHGPIILKFIDHREKTTVLSNCHKLKGQNISISEDFSAETRQIRKHLWDSTADDRKAGAKVRLQYDKIKVDNQTYRWDSAQMKRIPVTFRQENPAGLQ